MQLSESVWIFHSQSIGHRAQSDKAGFFRTMECCLLFAEQAVMRSYKAAIWRKVQFSHCLLVTVRWDEWEMCNATCFLLVMREGVMRLWFRNMCNVSYCLCGSWNEMRWTWLQDCNATCSRLLVVEKDMMRLQFRKTCNITCFLLVIGHKMNLWFRKCGMSLTMICWP